MNRMLKRLVSVMLSLAMVVSCIQYSPKAVSADETEVSTLPTSREIDNLNAPEDVYLLDFRNDTNNPGYRMYFTDADKDVYTLAEGDKKYFDVYLDGEKFTTVNKSGETVSLDGLDLVDGQVYEITMKEVLAKDESLTGEEDTDDETQVLESNVSAKNYFTYREEGNVPVKVDGEDTGISKVYIMTSRNEKTKNHNLYRSGDKVDVKSSLIVTNEDGTTDSSGDGTIKLRGNSTSTGQKKPYNIKFSSKTNVLGFGAAKKWSLLANTFDKSLIRNQIGMQFHNYVENNFQVDKFSSQCAPVDVYLDGRYLGSYLLLESVEQGKTRVNITADNKYNDEILLELDTTGRDTNAEAHLSWDNTLTDLGMGFTINEPEGPGYTSDQTEKDEYDAEYGGKKSRVTSFIKKFEAAIKDGGDGTLDEIEKYIDIDSFVNYYITAEFMRITDVGFSSVRYYIKDTGNWKEISDAGGDPEEVVHNDKLYAGPLWDMDLSSGNADGAAANPDNDMHAMNDNPWFKHLLKNKEFMERVVERYEELLPKMHELVAVGGIIDQLYNTLLKSATANYSDLAYNYFSENDTGIDTSGYVGYNTGWGIDKLYTAGHHQCATVEEAKATGNVSGSLVIHDNWKDYVDDFKSYLTGRITYMTAQLDAKDISEVYKDITDQIGSYAYNLAKKKDTTIYKSCHQEGRQEYINDGNVTTKCPLTNADSSSGWGTEGEVYATVDLGACYKADTIDQIVVQYNNSDANDTVIGKAYKIQYSIDGEQFDDVYSTDSATLDTNHRTVVDVSQQTGVVRYVRIYFPKSATYGMQITEFAVLDTDKDAETVTVDIPKDITNLTLTAPEKNQIDVQFDASSSEDVTYVVLVDNETVIQDAKAGEVNTITDVKTGKHTVKVITKNATGFASQGVSATVMVTGDISIEDMMTNEDYNLALNKSWVLLQANGEEGQNSTEGTGSITDGIAKNENAYYSTPVKGQAGSYFTIDLGKEYDVKGIDKVCVWYRLNYGGCYPESGGHQIQFSNDNKDFVTVATVTQTELNAQRNEQASSPFMISADIENAQEEIASVRYVRVYYPNSVAYGAQVTEIGVFDTDLNASVYEGKVEVPEAASVTAKASAYNTIEYTIIPSEEQEGYTYNVSVAGQTFRNVEAGTYTLENIEAGEYTVTVKSVDTQGNISDGIKSNKVTVKDGYTYEKITTPEGKTFPDKNDNGNNYLRYTGITATGSTEAQSAGYAIDNVSNTRWESAKSDPQDITIDLGSVYSVKELDVLWETANAKNYTVWISTDGKTFNTAATVKEAVAGERCDKITFTDAVEARQIKIIGTARNTEYGYSIYEMAVYGQDEQKEYVPILGAVKDVLVDSYAKWTGRYIVSFKEDQVATSYNVYVDDVFIKNIKGSGYYITGEELSDKNIENGEHTVAVTSVDTDGSESKKATATFTVSDSSTTNTDIAQIYISTQGRSISGNYFAKQGDGSKNVNVAVVDKSGTSTKDIIDSDADIKIRGNSTAGAEKKPWNIKFNKKQELLGMKGKAKKWSLLANAFDKSLMRNALVMQLASAMGLDYTSECRFVDVYLNGEYQGNYLLIESIDVGSGRIEIDSEDDTNNDILLEVDNNGRDSDDAYHLNKTGLGMLLMLGSPELAPANTTNESEQADIAKYQNKIDNTEKLIADFEEALKADDLDEVSKYIDVESFAKFYIVNEFFRNQDFNFSSTRFYVKNDKLYAGPCWDYDLSSGNIGPYYSGEYKDGVTYNSYKATDMVWYRYLMNNEEFKSIVIKYYYQYLPEIKALFDGTKADEGYGIDGILNQYESSFIRNYTSSDKNGAGWNVMTPDQADAYSNANLFDDEQTEDTTKTGRWATYEEAVEYLRDWLLNRDKWLESEWDINSVSVISTDLAITGFQVSTVLGENNDEVGIRTVYQHEPTVEGQEVVEFGLIYGLDGLGLTDGDMTYNNDATYDNGVVKTITNAATSAGLCQVQMGQSDTALYYVRTMPVSGGLNANYKVRPYAILQDGTIAYGLIDSYNVFKVAKTLYEGGQMPTQTAHQALYDKIIAPVIAEDDTQTITETDYNWNKTLVKNDIAVAENALNIEGYQMTSSLGGVEGKMGLRVVYSVEGEFSEIGLIYGLALGENGATVDDMTLENAADTTNKYVVSYKTTEENGNLHTQMGASDTAQYYARTMNVSGQSKSAYTATYMVRVYGKDAEGNITYSDVKSYSVIDVAEQLYDNDLMSTVAGHDALYTNILTKVDSEYKKVDYDYQNTMTK